jgi:'Cold-shock' DNA-binding domain
MKRQKGTVKWFDNRSGEGFIRVGGKSIYVHWSAIASKEACGGLPDAYKVPKQVWCVLFKGMEVEVDVFEDSHYTQISKVY